MSEKLFLDADAESENENSEERMILKDELKNAIATKKEKNNSNNNNDEVLMYIASMENQIISLKKQMSENERNNNMYGEAALKLVNILYETPEELLAELSEIPRNAVLPLSIIQMKEELLDPNRDKMARPISKCWRMNYYRLMRGVGRAHFMTGTSIAKEQINSAGELKKPFSSLEL